MTKPPLIIALQCWNGDIEQAIELARLISDIETSAGNAPREDIEFCVSVKRNTDPGKVAELVCEAARGFKKVHIILSKRFGTGHPAGPNDLWAETMMRLSIKKDAGQTNATGVLTFEPDCIPLRPDWLTLLREAWDRAKDQGIECLGHAHRFNDSRSPRHINGNAIFDIQITDPGHHPQMTGSSSDVGWDVEHGALLLQIGRDTDLICQKYRMHRITTAEVAAIRKNGNIPALFHGIKTTDGIKAVRELMSIDEWRVRAGQPVIEKPKIKREREIRPGLPTFSISILAMNGLEMTKRCINSVLANSSDFELILTDNGSDDGTAEYFLNLQKQNPISVSMTINKKNNGFSYPNNRALMVHAKGTYFITLNNDAEVPSGWLEKLEEPFLTEDNVAITGPEGSCCKWATNDNFHGVPGGQVEYIEGSCMCVKTEIARKLGLFSDYIEFAYGEDCDLSLRMRAAGYAILTVPFKIKHERSATSKHIEGIRDIQNRNHQTMMKRWGHYLTTRRFNWPILVRRMGAIGDVLLTTPVIRAIHEQQPESPIYVQTNTPEIFSGNPHIINATEFEPIIPGLQVINLDMAYENRPGVNIVDAYLEQATYRSNDHRTELFADPQDVIAMKTFYTGKFAAIHPLKTTWEGKNWSGDKWEEVIGLLKQRGYGIVIVGNGVVEARFGGDQTTSCACNMTTISQLSAILQCCDLFIGHDSFPMHAAIASGCPTIGLFGISASSIVLPRGSNAMGVDADPNHPMTGVRHKHAGITMLECNGNNPMDTITVSWVMEAVDKMRTIQPKTTT